MVERQSAERCRGLAERSGFWKLPNGWREQSDWSVDGGCDGSTISRHRVLIKGMSALALFKFLLHGMTRIWRRIHSRSFVMIRTETRILSERANVCNPKRVADKTNIYYKFGTPGRPIVNSSTVRMRKYSNTNS